MNTFAAKNRLFIVGFQHGMEGPIRDQFGPEVFFLSAGFQTTKSQMNLLLAQVHLLVKQEEIQEVFFLEDACYPEGLMSRNREQSSHQLRDLLEEDPFIQQEIYKNQLVMRTLLCLPTEQCMDLTALTQASGNMQIPQYHERYS